MLIVNLNFGFSHILIISFEIKFYRIGDRISKNDKYFVSFQILHTVTEGKVTFDPVVF